MAEGPPPDSGPLQPRGHSQGQLWSCPGRQERPQRASSDTWHSGPCRLLTPELAARALWPPPPHRAHSLPTAAPHTKVMVPRAWLLALSSLDAFSASACCLLTAPPYLEGQTASVCAGLLCPDGRRGSRLCATESLQPGAPCLSKPAAGARELLEAWQAYAPASARSGCRRGPVES